MTTTYDRDAVFPAQLLSERFHETDLNLSAAALHTLLNCGASGADVVDALGQVLEAHSRRIGMDEKIGVPLCTVYVDERAQFIDSVALVRDEDDPRGFTLRRIVEHDFRDNPYAAYVCDIADETGTETTRIVDVTAVTALPDTTDEDVRHITELEVASLAVGMVLADDDGEAAVTVIQARRSSRFPELMFVETTAGSFYMEADSVTHVLTDTL